MLRESIPRHPEIPRREGSGALEEEEEEGCQDRYRVFSTFLSLSHLKHFFL